MVFTSSLKDVIERKGMRVEDFARSVGIGRTTAYRLINQGHIRAIKIGARTIIPRSEVDRLLSAGSDTNRAR